MADAERPASARDSAHMRRALSLARKGWGRTAPNPMVGAVVVRDGAVVGEGYHREYGGPHAEVHALRAGGGVQRLRAAGIEVAVGVEEDAARELNAAFLHAVASDRPFVTLKLALSL